MFFSSCWAFSAIAALESQYFLKYGSTSRLSEQQLVDCAYGTTRSGCDGGWMDEAWQYIKDAPGSNLDISYPVKF